ncbi:MAG TPA: metallophosphoesterase [Nocardioidaceae bacterium]|nr:metallophosphoesterase [Nocardioidaceae bacterium]
MKREELAKHYGQLNFTPQDSVRWLAPGELIRAGIKTLLSAVFADYADKREIQNSFEDHVVTVPAHLIGPGRDFWFDYTADTGDGFDATFTVASLLGQPSLRVEGVEGELPRGRMLVLGGDEVYPTASAKAYEDRLIGPFRAAMPTATPEPLMLALPGNHDWYDGLTAFLRVFTHERYIGGWKTAQPRSYFTAKLPYGWWLVGLDSQFDSYFDDPQIKYFERTLTANLSEGDGVILCSASPTWMKTIGDPDAFNSLDWFERKFIRSRRIPGTDQREATGAEVRLFLTGDKHHYVRYVEQFGADDVVEPGIARQLVTCGLGGAYSSATHDLVEELHLLPEDSRSWRDGDGAATFRQEGEMYPSPATSRLWKARIAVPWCPQWLVRRNPGLLSLVGGLHLAIFSVLLLIFWQGVGTAENRGLFGAYLDSGWDELFGFAGELLAVAAVAAAIGLAPMVRRRPPIVSVAVTALVLTQLLVGLACFVGFGLLPHAQFLLLPDWIQLTSGAAVAAVVGGLVGVSAFGLYVVFGKSDSAKEWAYSGQAIDDGKGFLRIRLDSDGTLTIHPLVVDEVHRDFAISPDPVQLKANRSTRVPVPEGDLPAPRLIEQPFTILRSATKETS